MQKRCSIQLASLFQRNKITILKILRRKRKSKFVSLQIKFIRAICATHKALEKEKIAQLGYYDFNSVMKIDVDWIEIIVPEIFLRWKLSFFKVVGHHCNYEFYF